MIHVFKHLRAITTFITYFILTYLPQIKADVLCTCKVVQIRIFSIFWIRYLWVNPLSLVVGVVDLFGFPFTLHKTTLQNYVCMSGMKQLHVIILTHYTTTHLVVRVGYHRWFPFPICVIIPVTWFLGVWIGNVFRLIPVLQTVK